MIYETFCQALQNIWSNKFRTFLTMLGIIIGVTAVIVIVGLGNGMTQSIESSFADMGTDLLSVQVMGYLFSALATKLLPLVITGMEMSVVPSLDSVAVAFGISVGIGVLFGYLPAKRAARLNPIEALRYD